jgi:hypothetical protein
MGKSKKQAQALGIKLSRERRPGSIFLRRQGFDTPKEPDKKHCETSKSVVSV